MNHQCNIDNGEEILTMHSRVFPAIWKLLESGATLDKNTAAASCHCDPKTAQRILSHLHCEEQIYIIDWTLAGDSNVFIPVYKLGDYKRDKPRPVAITADRSKYQRERRKDIDVREREAD